MYPFRNILFTTDFSPNSKSALKYVAAFARQSGARIFIHNAQEGTLPPQPLKISDRALSENGFDWITAIKHEMQALADSDLLKDLPVHMILSEGNPIQEIPRIIREYDIDLTTLSTNTHNKIGGAIGSTTLNVLAQANCPLLITRQGTHDFVFYKGSETTFALNRILLATDFSENEEGARKMAMALAREHNADLQVLHSIGSFLIYLKSVSIGGSEDVETRIRKDAEQRLKQIADSATATGIKTETLLTEGRLYDETLRIAKERDIDLIVIGTGRPGSSNLPTLGRNAERIVRGALCPVLVVRQGTFQSQ